MIEGAFLFTKESNDCRIFRGNHCLILFFCLFCPHYRILNGLIPPCGMKNRIKWLFLWGIGFCLDVASAPPVADDELLLHLFELSSKNLNYSSVIPEDSILRLCAEVGARVRRKQDYDHLFKVEQIAVNSLCLKGDVGLAINKAQQMYEEARRRESNLGVILALQAIGNTYMHSNQDEQAFTAFTEAVAKTDRLTTADVKLRLYLQLVQVCKNRNDLEHMSFYLEMCRRLLKESTLSGKERYEFYTLCYETLYYMDVGHAEQAHLNLGRIGDAVHLDRVYRRWYYHVAFHYHALVNDYQQALAYCDSTLWETEKGLNLSEYRSAMTDKALLLEKTGDKGKACQLYEEIKELSDSLNVKRYTRQIDSLHIMYLTDQLAVENAVARNRLLTWVLWGCGLILCGGICLFAIARKRNNDLIASRKKLISVREETADSIQSKSMFLSNMSHELRTPLNGIVGFSAILTSGDEIDSETKLQCAESIKQNADLLLKLIKDVVDVSGLKGDCIHFTYGIYNVVTLCRNVVDTVGKVKQTEATLHFSTSLRQLDVYTDNGRLQQVLINLLVNATKFTQTGTITLTLEVDELRQEAVFAVEDTGCGIPLERQPRIFERFEKLHEGIQGVGLGLSICQLIVEHVGGRIWVDPAYTSGARFVFTHPLNNELKSESL